MFTIGPIGFAAPALLLGLIVLPVLWFLLRAVPPAPIRRRFPGVALLLGLTDDKNETDKTPWWLLLLRMLAIAAMIVGFAGPILNPQTQETGDGPLLALIDGTWADARDWQRRIDRVEAALTEASRSGRPVAVVTLTDPPAGALAFQAADSWLPRLAGLTPRPWIPEADGIDTWWAGVGDARFDTLWISDGLDHPWRADLLDRLETRGAVRVFESPAPIVALRPARFEEGLLQLAATRPETDTALDLTVAGHGLDPGGTPRILTRALLAFASGQGEAETQLSLPPELRNRISRFEIEAIRSAAAVTLTDDALKRREVALIAGRDDREGLQLLSPTHYLEQALEPTADLIEGGLSDVILANPDVIILADVATITDSERSELEAWIDEGGMLLRFAGPRLAASDISRDAEDSLMPVRLRAGGRTVGGAMSWGEPKALRPFADTSPFFGLAVPDEVRISAQVMAQPDPLLGERTIASLADGTPLVTRKRVGQGQIVLFHVTANAEWASLPLSGLFVQMLERLAVSTRPAVPDIDELRGTTWVPDQVLTAFGGMEDAGTLAGIAGEDLARGVPGPDVLPGLYAGEDRRIALNTIGAETQLSASNWPARIAVEGLEVTRQTELKGGFLSAGLLALLADILASLWIAGRLIGPRPGAATAQILALAIVLGGAPSGARAQDTLSDDVFARAATSEVVLAHVITGDARTDKMAADGLRGLSQALTRRTSVEPAEPIAVNLETDDLAFFPFLYWPIAQDQPLPSDEAYGRLNRYLQTGGMILFDTRDANISGFGGSSPAARKLRALARPLDIPPLEQIPGDHVLTRTFYLLQDFPGRFASRDVWVEAAPADAEQVEGMPFRNLNDNVTPVVIGGNDWAAAWAMDAGGAPMYPVGRGFAGERQREIAYRFGINLIMHVLTGNYKSDQVHVPALLDRLGQ